MALTPLNLYARLVDLDLFDGTNPAQVTVQRSNLGDKQNPPVAISIATVTVDAVATHNQIFAWSSGHVKDGAGSLRLGVRHGCAFTNAVIEAMGGPTYQGPIKRYLVQLSRTGGYPFCTAAWLDGVTINPGGSERGIIIETSDTFTAYQRAIIDHATYNGAPLRAVLGAPVGFVPVTLEPGNNGTTIPGNYFPALGGLDKTPIGGPTLSASGRQVLAYAFHTDQTYTPYAVTPVNVDIWGDNPANGMLTVLQAASGQFYPDDPAPLGTRAHYHVDPLNHAVQAGRVGTVKKIDLVGVLPANTYEVDQTTTALFDASNLPIVRGLSTMRAEFAALFGSSNHGFPDGFTITAVTTLFDEIASTNVFTHHGTKSQAWYTCLPIVCVSTGNGGGGVGFMLDKTWHRLSQNLDVTSFALDGTAGIAYVGTLNGVFSWVVLASELLTTPQWAKVGGLSSAVRKVLAPSVNVVWALADSGNSTTGIYQYPAIGGEDNASLNFALWSRIYQGSNITDMAGGVGNLYTVDSSDSTNLIYQGGTTQKIQIPNGAGIVGLDYLPTLDAIAIRTTAGGAGLYVVVFAGAGANPVGLINIGGTLADSFGPLVINSVSQSNAASLNGSPCRLLAATDQGAWFTNGFPGYGAIEWQPATAQSGVGDASIDFIVASPEQWILGQPFEQVIVATGTTLSISHSGAVWFTDILAAPLDLGPFWFELCRKRLGGYPDSGVGGIGGNVTLTVDMGELLTIPTTGAMARYALPDNFVWVRRLTPGRNEYVFVLDILDSPAPYFAVESGDVTDITADDSRGSIAASEAAALAALRYMLEVSQPPLTLPLTGMSYWAQEAALPQLITSDLCHVTYTDTQIGDDGTITTVCDWGNLPVYVQTYQEQFDTSKGIMAVDLGVGTVMTFLDDNQTLLEQFMAGTAYGLSKSNRYAPRKGVR